MAKTIRFADSPLLDAMREAARDVEAIKRTSFFPARDTLWLVATSAQPTRTAALRTAFPQ